MKVSAIIVAAGSGSRMQTNIKKPYLDIAGVPLIVRTLRVFENSASIKDVILVVGDQELDYAKRLIEQYGLRKVTRYAPGGNERQTSVYNGIQAVESDADIILVHDGARPFITEHDIDEVIKEAVEHGASTIGTPVKDTMKKAANLFVQETIPRETLFSIQTPQAFQTKLLQKAHKKAKEEGYRGTDDASLVEWIGRPVRIVTGSYRNIKITTPEDLLIAEAFLQDECK